MDEVDSAGDAAPGRSAREGASALLCGRLIGGREVWRMLARPAAPVRDGGGMLPEDDIVPLLLRGAGRLESRTAVCRDMTRIGKVIVEHC